MSRDRMLSGHAKEKGFVVNEERDRQIRELINPFTLWAKEPALVATTVANMVIASLHYAEAMGRYAIDGPTTVFIMAMVGSLGVLIRSQVSPADPSTRLGPKVGP